MSRNNFLFSCMRQKVVSSFFAFMFSLLIAIWSVGVYRKRFQDPHAKLPTISLKEVQGKDNIVPFLVLGSGPASLSAALYGARTKIKTVVLRGNQPGGQLTGTTFIENWPGIRKIRGPEVVQDLEQQAAQFGAIMVSDTAKSVDFSQWPYIIITEEGKKLHAMALFVGTGATPRRLGVKGENEFWGRGVTTCAICDAPFHKGHDVVVIGGGDSAMEEALELSPYAKTVRVLVRGDKMRASPSMIAQVGRCTNVNIVYNVQLHEIKGSHGHVSGIVIRNTSANTFETWDEVKGVFLAIGHEPNTKIFNGQLETNANGYIKLKSRRQETSRPGVFAAGDVADDRYRQAGVAAGDGIKGGLDAVWWLGHLGYNSEVEASLEPYFFDPHFDARIEVDEVTSIRELDKIMEEHSDKVIILDFYTQFCPSCIHMMPVIEWVGTKMSDKVLFLKVNASIAFDLVKKYEANQVPYFIVLKKGKVVDSTPDVMDRSMMYQFAKKNVD